MKSSQRPPGSRPGDPPGWRLAFAIWESIRADGRNAMIKLALLVALSFAGMLVATATLGPWPLIVGLAGAGIRPRRHSCHHLRCAGLDDDRSARQDRRWPD